MKQCRSHHAGGRKVRVKAAGSLPVSEQHFVGDWGSKLRLKGQRWAVEQYERCCMFSIKSFMIKLHGGLWEIMRFESGAAFLKVLGPWQRRPALLSKNTLFTVLKRATPISQPSLAKTIMKNTQHETEQPLSKSRFGLIFQGCRVQAASTDFSRAIWVGSILGAPGTRGCFF